MGEKTEAQKKYMEKFMVARVRMERERYAAVQAHAEARGGSTTAFINQAIDKPSSGITPLQERLGKNKRGRPAGAAA